VIVYFLARIGSYDFLDRVVNLLEEEFDVGVRIDVRVKLQLTVTNNDAAIKMT